MPKYVVNRRLEHDNEIIKPGGTLELDELDAEPLIKIEAISLAPEVQMSPDERLGAIQAAIGELDPQDAEQWLQNGFPDLAALESKLGFSPTAAERDAAWKTVKGA